MKPIFSLFAVMSLSVATPACAHRLDEYPQAATFAVDGNHVAVEMRLTPGVEVLGKVLAVIDTNGDGVILGIRAQWLCGTGALRSVAHHRQPPSTASVGLVEVPKT